MRRKKSLRVKFYLYEGSIKDNEYQIYCRITHNRRKTEIATGLFVAENNWDENFEGHRQRSHELNEELSKIKGHIIHIKDQLEYEEKPVSAKILKRIYIGEDQLKVFIIKYFEDLIDKQFESRIWKVSTRDLYNQTKGWVQYFIKSKYHEDDILINEINYNFIKDLDHFLNSTPSKETGIPLDKTTIYKHHSRFRTALLNAKKEGHLKVYPYENFTLKKPEDETVFLTEEELQAMIEHDLGGNKSLQRARDIFVFAAHTGLRFKDLQNLTVDQIKIRKGIYFIEKKQSKTGKLVGVPILPKALDIFFKYDLPEREITGKVLPKFTGKINTTIKIVADLVGIEKSLHMHVARHTCATLLLIKGISIKEVSAWLGHSSIAQTEHYTHLIFDHLGKHIEKFYETAVG